MSRIWILVEMQVIQVNLQSGEVFNTSSSSRSGFQSDIISYYYFSKILKYPITLKVVQVNLQSDGLFYHPVVQTDFSQTYSKFWYKVCE